jgi:hypothetical protein
MRAGTCEYGREYSCIQSLGRSSPHSCRLQSDSQHNAEFCGTMSWLDAKQSDVKNAHDSLRSYVEGLLGMHFDYIDAPNQ